MGIVGTLLAAISSNYAKRAHEMTITILAEAWIGTDYLPHEIPDDEPTH